VRAQPQYRVIVDPPAVTVIGSIPNGIPQETVTITLCFREAISTSANSSYCPLGLHTETLDNTAIDGQLVELALGGGADALPAAYPTAGSIFLGVGLLVTITGGENSRVLGTTLFIQVNGAPASTGAPGTPITTFVSQFTVGGM
jgi:hypothetical protein